MLNWARNKRKNPKALLTSKCFDWKSASNGRNFRVLIALFLTWFPCISRKETILMKHKCPLLPNCTFNFSDIQVNGAAFMIQKNVVFRHNSFDQSLWSKSMVIDVAINQTNDKTVMNNDEIFPPVSRSSLFPKSDTINSIILITATGMQRKIETIQKKAKTVIKRMPQPMIYPSGHHWKECGCQCRFRHNGIMKNSYVVLFVFWTWWLSCHFCVRHFGKRNSIQSTPIRKIWFISKSSANHQQRLSKTNGLRDQINKKGK